jgi:STE24 endopeptidase
MIATAPEAATLAYLSQMSPQALAKAVAYTHGKEWLLLGGWVVSMVTTWLIVRSGLLNRVNDSLQKGRARPLLASLLVGLAYFVISSILELPWSIYSDWWFETSFGMTSQTLGGWFVDGLKTGWFGLLMGSVFVLLVYGFLRRARKIWWVWASGLVVLLLAFVMVVAPVAISPLLNTYKPAPAGAVRDEVVRLGQATGTPTDKIFIFDGSKQSNRYTANVSGIGRTARVAMSDVMFQKGADIAEVRGVVGHEMGHYIHQHIFFQLGIFSVLSLVLFFLTDRLFPTFVRLFGARVTGIEDPAGLPILFAIIGTLSLIALPITNTISREIESDADLFSLEHAHEPDGLAKALVKTADYRAPTPSELEEFIFYDHPSVGRRVRRAMEWKAAHPDLVGQK